MSVADEGRTVRRALASVALVLLTFCAFLPALGNGFILDYDDGTNLRDNLHFRGLGPAEIAWAWRTMLLGVYQPLAWMELSAEYETWGLAPWGYHLVSIAWHAANACLVYLLTDRLLMLARPELATGDRSLGAVLGAAMFAVHPLRVEAVAWASCQSYLPCACFSMLALLAYLRAQTTGPRGPLLVICWLLQATALLHKASAVPLPLVYLIVDASAPEVRTIAAAARLAEKLPYFLLSVVFGVLALVARGETEVVADRRGTESRVAQAGDAVGFYLRKTIAPARLTPFHPLPGRASLGQPRFLLETGAVVGLTVALIVLRKRWPAATAAWGAYLALLGPNTGFIRSGPMGNADRYSYLPTIGLFILAGAGLASLRVVSRPRPVAVAAAVLASLLVAVLVFLTWRQCAVWHDSRTLDEHAASVFADVVRSHPDSAESHLDLGASLVRCGRRDEALREFRAALRLDPGMAATHAALGQSLAERGQLAEGVAELSEAVRLDPSSADIHAARAGILSRQDRLAGAEAEYREARRLEPANPYWRVGLGLVLYRQGRLADAEAELLEAARRRPDNPLIHDYLQRVRQAGLAQ